eukprot:1141188-Pelagomonas_calceolata.AAC.10
MLARPRLQSANNIRFYCPLWDICLATDDHKPTIANQPHPVHSTPKCQYIAFRASVKQLLYIHSMPHNPGCPDMHADVP